MNPLLHAQLGPVIGLEIEAQPPNPAAPVRVTVRVQSGPELEFYVARDHARAIRIGDIIFASTGAP